MNTTTTCCSPVIVATRRSLLRRWGQDWRAALRAHLQAHRERTRLRAEWRSLQGLSDATLRDIGLGDRQPAPGYTLGVMDHERGRWS